MESADQAKALARRCRELAAAATDEQTRKSLELLAEDYEARGSELDAALPPPQMTRPE